MNQIRTKNVIDYNEMYRRSKIIPNGRDWFIEQNINLVYHIVEHKIDCNHAKRVMKLDKEDICQSGMVGLLKAYESFDESKNRKWSTYATVCIMNEIFMLLRKGKKFGREVKSIEESIFRDKDGNTVSLSESVFDERDAYLEFENTVLTGLIIMQLFDSVKGREKQVLSLVVKNSFQNQREISEVTGIPRSYVSRIMGKISKKALKIRKQLLSS